MFKDDEAPIECKHNIKKDGLSRVKVPCKSTTGDAIKEEVPTFSGKETGDHFLHTVRRTRALVERHDLWEASAVDRNSLDFETASRAMMGDALDVW